MRTALVVLAVVVGILVVGGLFVGMIVKNFYNGTIELNEQVSEQWSNVENAYQLRADKTQNLVQIVKGAAEFERGTLTDVVEARAKATSINVDPTNLTPEQVQRFEQAQQQFGGALSRLIATIERYPDLKAVQAYQDFQVQYEAMENRIGVERRKFNEVARKYNTRIKRFPGNVMAGYFDFEEKGYFEAAEGTDQAPNISFD